MSERVLLINFPDGIEYRKVLVTEGWIEVVYSSEEDTNFPVLSETIGETFNISKPKPLIGGGETFQREGSPYWYCYLKEGHDLFMCLPTDELTEADLFYDYRARKPRFYESEDEREFMSNCMEALKRKPEKGFVWIPAFEPTLGEDGILQIVPDCELNLHGDCEQFNKLCEEYSPKNGSTMAQIHTYFLLAVSWLKHGIATVEQLVHNSSQIGHYSDSPNHKAGYEVTGQREFGGVFGYIGNSQIIVKNQAVSTGYSYVGGSRISSNGGKCSFSYVEKVHFPNYNFYNDVPLLELKG